MNKPRSKPIEANLFWTGKRWVRVTEKPVLTQYTGPVPTRSNGKRNW